MHRILLAAAALIAALAAATAVRISGPPPARASLLPSGAGCAWAGETDQRDVNVGAPDLDAYYWMDVLTPSSSERIQITGTYPRARYFSFHVYDSSGDYLTSIYDAQIRAENGSGNPYRHRVSPHLARRYTVQIQYGPRPAHPGANTLYVNPASTHGAALLVYRIYVPQNPADPSGGVPFPQVSTQSADGSTTLLQQGGCATTPPAGGSVLWQELADSDYPAFAPTPPVAGATRLPTWQRSFGSQLGNAQNAYLGALISRQYGPLVVIHARVPTFPNTRRGQPVYGHHQVRYWSFCTYDSRGQAGFGCAADYHAAIRHRSVTYVISDPGARPANATARHGVTWLPWGGDQDSAQVVLRNMLPGPHFRHAVQRIAKGASPRRVMGAYYPQAVYCTTQAFSKGGWRKCFRDAGLR